ncbi:MAG: hypothetical protein AAGD07_02290 [Planctomycetota bacterium]
MNPDSPFLNRRVLRAATAALGLSVVLVVGWAVWPSNLGSLQSSAATRPTQSSQHSDPPRFLESVLASVVAKRLQGTRVSPRESTKPIPPPPTMTRPNQSKPLDQLGIRLVGTVLEPGRPSVAIAVSHDGRVVFRSAGESVPTRAGEYRLTRIEARHVEGECDGERYRVELGSPAQSIGGSQAGRVRDVNVMDERDSGDELSDESTVVDPTPPMDEELPLGSEEDWPDGLEAELDFLNGN